MIIIFIYICNLTINYSCVKNICCYSKYFCLNPIEYFIKYNEMTYIVLNIQQYFAVRIYEPIDKRKIHTKILIQRIEESDIPSDIIVGLKDFLQELLDEDLYRKPVENYFSPKEDSLTKLKKILRKNHMEFDILGEKAFEDVTQYVEKTSQPWEDIIDLIIHGKYLHP